VKRTFQKQNHENTKVRKHENEEKMGHALEDMTLFGLLFRVFVFFVLSCFRD